MAYENIAEKLLEGDLAARQMPLIALWPLSISHLTTIELLLQTSSSLCP
jgi:hypothetical protein